jgi:hypothetical protein
VVDIQNNSCRHINPIVQLGANAQLWKFSGFMAILNLQKDQKLSLL